MMQEIKPITFASIAPLPSISEWYLSENPTVTFLPKTAAYSNSETIEFRTVL